MKAGDVAPFPVERLHGATANHGVGNVLAFSANSIAGRLCCSLLYVRPLVSEERARQVLERARALLLAAAGMEKPAAVPETEPEPSAA